MPASPILDFYRGTGTDHAGRTLVDILGFDHEALECHHDYIQWLFPLPEPSGALRTAPLLGADDIAAFASDPILRDELRRSLDLMLDFYGLLRVEGPAVRMAPHFGQRVPVWLTPMNHNYLRLTRILRSCTLLGLGPEARALLDALEQIAIAAEGIIPERSLAFWRGAVG